MIILTNEEMENFYLSNVGKNFISNDKSSEDLKLRKSIKIIPEYEYEIYLSHSKKLDEFSFYLKKKKEIVMNYEDIINVNSIWENLLRTMNPQERSELNDTLFIDINRRLTNYLSSLITFINDYIENRVIKKGFGEKSKEYLKFKEKTGCWYDNSFSYKFLYNLRNYAIHYRFPLQNINYELEYQADRMNQIRFSLDLCFDKSKLLQNTNFKKKLEYEMESYNEEFPLMPILSNIQFIHDDIINLLLEIIGEKYIEAANYICTMVSEIIETGEIGIIEIGTIHQENDLIRTSTRQIQLQIAQDILKLAKTMEK